MGKEEYMLIIIHGQKVTEKMEWETNRIWGKLTKDKNRIYNFNSTGRTERMIRSNNPKESS
jgi:ABC-type Fe3+-citrate transport system substrate-binding protein